MNLEKLRSGKYRVRVWDNNLGQNVTVGTFPTRTIAKDAGREAEQSYYRRGYVDQKLDTTLEGLVDEFLATIAHVAPSTRQFYEMAFKHAKTHFGAKTSVRRIKRQKVEQYVAYLISKKLAATTVRSYLRAFGTLMERAVSWEYREDNPALKLPNLPQRKRAEDSVRAITPEEHARLVDAIATEFRNGRGEKHYRGYRLMVWVMPFVGLRRSEIQGLTWDAVDLDAQIIRVERQLRRDGTLTDDLKTPKARRRVRLQDKVVKVLREWKLECAANEGDLVFPSMKGSPQNAQQFYRIWGKATVTAKLDGLDPHDLRHSFATWNLTAGCNPRWVADQMGHESPSVTLDTYAHLLPKEDDRAACKVESWYDSQPTSAESCSSHILPTPAKTGTED